MIILKISTSWKMADDLGILIPFVLKIRVHQGEQTTNLRVGPHSPGWDPVHKGGTPITRVGPRSPGQDTFKKIIVFRYKIQKKGKIYTGLCHAIVKDVSFLFISIIYHLIVWFDCILPLNIFHAKTAQTVIFFHLGRDGYKYLGKK